MSQYKPVLVYVDEDTWQEFQKLAGRQRVSARLRELVRQDLAAARQAKRSTARATR